MRVLVLMGLCGVVASTTGAWAQTDTVLGVSSARWFMAGGLIAAVSFAAIFARKIGELQAEWNHEELIAWHAAHTQCVSCKRWMPSTERMLWPDHKPHCVTCGLKRRVELRVMRGGKDVA